MYNSSIQTPAPLYCHFYTKQEILNESLEHVQYLLLLLYSPDLSQSLDA